jgi:hypothetical protein
MAGPISVRSAWQAAIFAHALPDKRARLPRFLMVFIGA